MGDDSALVVNEVARAAKIDLLWVVKKEERKERKKERKRKKKEDFLNDQCAEFTYPFSLPLTFC